MISISVSDPERSGRARLVSRHGWNVTAAWGVAWDETRDLWTVTHMSTGTAAYSHRSTRRAVDCAVELGAIYDVPGGKPGERPEFPAGASDRMAPPPAGDLPPEDPTEAWRVLCRLRASVEARYGTGWLWPEEDTFKAAWPALTPRARVLVLHHDALHAVVGAEQDAAGEYELAARFTFASPAALRRSMGADAGLHRLYGALALCTLPIGCMRAGAAPLRGSQACSDYRP